MNKQKKIYPNLSFPLLPSWRLKRLKSVVMGKIENSEIMLKYGEKI